MNLPDIARTSPLFSGLSDQEKEGMLRGGHIRYYSRGHMLFTYGDPVMHFYIILSGTIRLFRASPGGHEKTIDILKAGQSICGGEIIEPSYRHWSNSAIVDDAKLLEFPISWLKEAAKKYSGFTLNLLSLLAKQAHMAEVEAEHQASMSAAQLVACFLQRLCILYDFNPKEFHLPYSKTLIASRLGMELETFSRALSKLREHGIRVEGTRVTVHDINLVEGYVCQSCSIAETCLAHQAHHCHSRSKMQV